MRIHHSLSVAALVFVPSIVNADVIFSQTPDISTATASDIDSQFGIVADDFTLGAETTITEVIWKGMYYSNGSAPSTDNFYINFYNDVGGSLGPLLSSFRVGNSVNRSDTGQDFSNCCDFFEYSATINSDFILSSGSYWLSILNNTRSDSNDDWYWGTQPFGGNNLLSTDSGRTWAPNKMISYFELKGNPTTVSNVPEPGSFVLLSLGLLGLFMMRRIPCEHKRHQVLERSSLIEV